MGSRAIYLVMMVIVPVGMILFFPSLLSEGLPLKVPTAIVDLDHTSMSRRMTRNLDATELIDVSKSCESYDAALSAVRRGEIFGFFVIPADFEKDALSGRRPSIEYYNNLTYFVPGTLAFKGFKTVAVGTASGVVKSKLEMSGIPDDVVGPLLQPVSMPDHPIGNPWLNYSVYLSPSFIFGTLALLIMIMTVFAVTMEIKNGTSPQWLATAGGNMGVALTGKLLPHFVIWSVIGQFALSVLFCWEGFPCGDLLAMVVAMELFVLASIAMGLLFCCIVPNTRLAMIMACLIGILTFSFAGYSFPVQNMYGAISIFSYMVPVRYLFLIYIFAGLNVEPVWFCRWYFVALMAFLPLPGLLIGRLRRACLKPVYVP